MGDQNVADDKQNLAIRKPYQALHMWEIRNAVVSHVSHADAISLLYVSKAFFHAAIRHVWGTRIVDSQHLFGLLEGFKFTHQARLVTVELKIPQPLPFGYFGRFNIYAPHVKALSYCLSQPMVDTYSLELHYHPEEIRALTNAISSNVLLPNLENIVLGRTFRTLRPMYDLRLLGLLVPPSLAKFTLVENISIDRSHYQTFFHFLGTRIVSACSSLQELSLLDTDEYNTTDERDRQELENMYSLKDLPVAESLTTLSVGSSILSAELLGWISKMPNLKSLTMRDLRGADAFMLSRLSSSHQSFQTLRNLRLIGCQIRSLVALWGTPVVSHVEHVEITIYARYDVQLEVLLNLLSISSLEIKTLFVGIDVFRYTDNGMVTLTPARLKGGPHPNVVKFALDGVEIEGPKPLSALARILPSLRDLQLSSYLIEFDDFAQLPSLAPQLQYLRVAGPEILGDALELERLLERETMPQSTVTSVLTYATFPFVTDFRPAVCDPISRFLARWWPRMQLEPPEFPNDEREYNWLAACHYINKRIIEIANE